MSPEGTWNQGDSQKNFRKTCWASVRHRHSFCIPDESACERTPCKKYQLFDSGGDFQMECWFCDPPREAQGQCGQDGRFVCRAHSEMRNGMLVCSECAAGGQDKLLENLLAAFARLAGASKCPGCGKAMLADDLENYAEFLALTSERQRQVRQKFSPVQRFCKFGCVACMDCFPKTIQPTFWSGHNHKCPVCGNTFYRSSD